MRSVRSLAARAVPDARELKMLRAMCFEVLRTIERVRADASGAPRPGSRQGKADSVPGE